MKGILLAVATAFALIGGGALAMQVAGDDLSQPTANRQRIIIGLDLSLSNPLVDDPAFAARVARRIADGVRNLSFASEVHVRTFGSYDPSSNNFTYDTVLSVRARPEVVAAEIETLIANTPRLVKSGKWRSQKTTNILAFLDNAARGIGCGGMPTTIVLASDGIEDSIYARLDRGDHLPMPDVHTFRGCTGLAIYGLGQGAGNPRLTSQLRSEWERWSHNAGFAHFEGLNDW